MERLNSRPEHIKQVVEGSLKRLRIDAIDLYYQHRVDHKRADRRRSGSSERSDPARKSETLRTVRGRRSKRYAEPMRFNCDCAAERIFAMVRRPEQEILPTLEELGIGFVPYSPLGKGFLTGKISADTKFDRLIFAVRSRAFVRRTWMRIRLWCALIGGFATRRKRRRRKSRSHGCWRRSRGSCPFRARPSCIDWKRTLELLSSNSHQTISGKLKRPPQTSVHGARYPEQIERMSYAESAHRLKQIVDEHKHSEKGEKDARNYAVRPA